MEWKAIQWTEEAWEKVCEKIESTSRRMSPMPARTANTYWKDQVGGA